MSQSGRGLGRHLLFSVVERLTLLCVMVHVLIMASVLCQFCSVVGSDWNCMQFQSITSQAQGDFFFLTWKSEVEMLFPAQKTKWWKSFCQQNCPRLLCLASSFSWFCLCLETFPFVIEYPVVKVLLTLVIFP